MDPNSFEGMQELARQGDYRFKHLLPQYEQQNQPWQQQEQTRQQEYQSSPQKTSQKGSDTTSYYQPAPPDLAQEQFFEGNRCANAGDWQQAITHYTSAIELKPAYCEAYYHRGILYANQKRPILALEDYNSALSFNPSYEVDRATKILTSRGKLYLFQVALDRSRYLTMAIADFTLAIDTKGQAHEKADTYFYRGHAYADLQQTQAAIADYTKAIELYTKAIKIYSAFKNTLSNYLSSLAYAQFNRGKLFQDLGKHRDAIQDFDLALQIHQKNPQANVLDPEYLKLAESYRQQSYKGIPGIFRPLAKVKLPSLKHSLHQTRRILWVGTKRLILFGGAIWLADSFLLNHAIQKKAIEMLPVVFSIADRSLPSLPYDSLKTITPPKTRLKVAPPYQQLESFLAVGKWQAANNETMNALQKVVGTQTALQSEASAKFKTCGAMKQINYLWEYYSRSHFGFKAQLQAYQTSESQFASRVGWLHGGNPYPLAVLLSMHEKAPKGMLPALWASNCPTCVQKWNDDYFQFLNDCQL
ncbi:MAG: GUN4 domain-containing protein [Leptolyngbyaceae cyanobacterium bins.302]|nr:GUN4 domain-containing protein [Leptolyngbyaceae cyanobacterium bins.302]